METAILSFLPETIKSLFKKGFNIEPLLCKRSKPAQNPKTLTLFPYKASETPVFGIQNKYNDLGLGSHLFYWNGEPYFEYNSYTKGLSGERLYNYGLGKFEFK